MTQGKSPVRQFRTLGSVEGAPRKGRPYSDPPRRSAKRGRPGRARSLPGQ